MKNIFEKHLGPNIIKMLNMFRHVNSHAANENSSGKAKSIPPLTGEDDNLIRLFVNTWPVGYKRENIVLSTLKLLNMRSYLYSMILNRKYGNNLHKLPNI